MRTEPVTDRDPLEDFDVTTATHDDATKTVYRKGQGPGVVVISEIPGITPYVADFARRVVDAGFTVWMPVLFGEPGKPASNAYAARSMTQACISREFTCLARGRASPVTAWLRGLARELHAAAGGPGVGAIGMCLTGGFALAMAIDDALSAPVLSQPSLPMPIGLAGKRDLGVSDEDLARVRSRAQDGLEVLGLRFAGDRFCPRERFDRLEAELGEQFIRVELPDESRNPRGKPAPAHSVVTTDCIDEPGEPTHDALERTLGFFREHLRPSSG